MPDIISLQGKIYLAERSAQGKPLKQSWVGDAPVCEVQLDSETQDLTESFSGDRLPYGEVAGKKKATVNLTLNEWILDMLVVGLYGKQVSLPPATVSGEALPTPIAVGEIFRLDNPFISDLVLTKSATPLVLDTDYRIVSPNAGLIEFLTAQATVVTAAYESEEAVAVTMFGQKPPERWLMLDGKDTVTGKSVLIDLFRVNFKPVGNLALIHERFGDLKLTGSMMYDPLNAGDPKLGGFGRYIQKKAA